MVSGIRNISDFLQALMLSAFPTDISISCNLQPFTCRSNVPPCTISLLAAIYFLVCHCHPDPIVELSMSQNNARYVYRFGEAVLVEGSRYDRIKTI